MNELEFTLIEAPIYQGQNLFGTSLGPAFIRQRLLDQGFNFKIQSIQSSQSQYSLNLNAYTQLNEICKNEYKKDKPLFIVGGDHSLSYGSIGGLLEINPNLKVLWVDAHGDINTRKTSATGSFHGMPLAFLMGADEFSDNKKNNYYLKPENLIYFGVRDLDIPEKKFLVENNITYFSMEHIQQQGLPYVIDKIDQLTRGSELHVSVDSDGFDPRFAPSTGVPVADGLTEAQVMLLLQQIGENTEIKSFEFVELNPQIFSSVQDVFNTAQIGINLFKQILQQFNQKARDYGQHDRKRYSAGAEVFQPYFE